MTILDRDKFLQLVGVLVGHPRVSRAKPRCYFGRTDFASADDEMLEDGRWYIRIDRSSLQGAWFLGSASAWLWSSYAASVSPGLPVAHRRAARADWLTAEQGLNFVQRELPGSAAIFSSMPGENRLRS
jgi:hypothetical protein